MLYLEKSPNQKTHESESAGFLDFGTSQGPKLIANAFFINPI